MRRLSFSGKSRRRKEATKEKPAVAEPSTYCDRILACGVHVQVLVLAGDSTYDKQPLPSRKSMGPIKSILNSPCDEPSKSSRQNSSRDVNAKSFRLLVRFVPARQRKQHTRSEPGLKHAHDDPQSDESLVVGNPSHGDGDTAPEKHYGREEDRGLRSGKNHVGRDLEDDVTHEEDCEGNAVFRGVHV